MLVPSMMLLHDGDSGFAYKQPNTIRIDSKANVVVLVTLEQQMRSGLDCLFFLLLLFICFAWVVNGLGRASGTSGKLKHVRVTQL